MKTYQIRRDSSGKVHVLVREDKTVVQPVSLKTGLAFHMEPGLSEYPLRDPKDEGFEYGYWGSGPSNLGWAILCNYLGEANLIRSEWERTPFLSWSLHIDFGKDMIATLTRDHTSHVITEAAIHGWLKMFYPGINIEEYQKKRDIYRENLRLYEELETWLEGTEGREDIDDSQEYIHKHDLWNRTFDDILAFETWVTELRRKRTPEG